MAGKIRGITIELNGDTSGLTKSLGDADKSIKSTKKQLKDVENLLKLDPSNVELLRQKELLLNTAIGETKSKLDLLKQAEEQMKTDGVDENSEQFMALQREIISTEEHLSSLQAEADSMDLGTTASDAQTDFEDLKSTTDSLSESLDKVKETAASVGEAADQVAEKTRGLSAAGAAVAGGILALGANAISTADDLATMSAQTGISTDTLQKFQYASDMVDVSVEDLATAFKKMKLNMDEHPESFEALGVSVTNTDGTFRNLEDVFYDTIGKLSEIEDGTERDLVSMDLFGKGADSLATIIDDGGATLKDYSDKAEELGLILDEDTITSLTSTGDKVDDLKARARSTLTELGAKLVDEMGPTLDTIFTKIGNLITKIGDLDGDTLSTIVTIGLVVAAISPLASAISGVSTLIGGVSSAIQFLLANPVVLLIAAIVGLVALIVTKGEKIKEVLQKIDDFISGVFEKDWTESFGAIGEVVNGLFASIEQIWHGTDGNGGIKGVLNGIIDFIQGVFKGDWDSAWNGIKDIFSGIWDAFVGIAKAPINLIIGLLNGLIDGLNMGIDGINKISVDVPEWVPLIGGKKFGFNLSHIGKIAYLAQGGILSAGNAIVGENGPELLSMANGNAIVQPLTNNTSNHNYGGITLNVYGAAGQSVQELADIIMDEIGNATRRQEAAFA